MQIARQALEDARSPAARTIGSCEPPNVSAGNQSQILCLSWHTDSKYTVVLELER